MIKMDFKNVDKTCSELLTELDQTRFDLHAVRLDILAPEFKTDDLPFIIKNIEKIIIDINRTTKKAQEMNACFLEEMKKSMKKEIKEKYASKD
jgi:hypothetical protein